MNRRKFLSYISKGTVAWGQLILLKGCDQKQNHKNVIANLANAEPIPPGAPKASAVSFSSRNFHPSGPNDPHDTWQAAKQFHATRFDWISLDLDFTRAAKERGYIFFGKFSSRVPWEENDEKAWSMSVRNLKDKPVIAPWKRTWPRPVCGCMNNPDYRKGYIQSCKNFIDAGADGIHRDEPRGNYMYARWGACFCEYCMKIFPKFLQQNSTASQRQKWGLSDLDRFNYKDYLQKRDAPVGDAFGKWEGDELKQLFVEFQKQTTIEFHQWVRDELNAYTNSTFPWSCNNGGRRWDEIHAIFDFALGELSERHAYPEHIYENNKTALEYNMKQVYTLTTPDIPLTRKVIATSYATGSHMVVPWDVYQPGGRPRIFLKPEDSADLYAFVRAHPHYLDDYERVMAVGGDFKAENVKQESAVKLEDASENVYVFVRALPGKTDAPVVLHLLDWRKTPKSFSLVLQNQQFFASGQISVKLLVPTPYDKELHAQAEQSNDFSRLSNIIDLETNTKKGMTRLQIPALNPWGMLIVEKK